MPVDIGTIILQWQNAGVYDFLLPFLLVFAIVFGILSATNIIGGQRGLHVIIALVIGFMAVGYNYSTELSFSQFLQILFPKLAIGLAVLLALLILVGLFIPDDERKYWGWGLGALGVIVAIIIIAQSFERFGWYNSGFYGDYVGWIIGAVLLLGIIIAVAASGGNREGHGGQTGKGRGKGNAAYTLW